MNKNNVWTMEKQVEECKKCTIKDACPDEEGHPLCTKLPNKQLNLTSQG
jgi:hypothetical protein